MGSMFVAYACALMAYLYLVFTDPGYNSNGDFTPVVVAYAFLIGLQVANCFSVPLSSGVDTLFVAMAWDPEALMREHPELYGKMIQVSVSWQAGYTLIGSWLIHYRSTRMCNKQFTHDRVEAFFGVI